MSDHNPSDPQRWVDEHGDFLYRYALVRVRNSSVAEDLVQDTFLVALQGTHQQTGPTAERRWMVGIIKHKIIDYFRRTAKEANQAQDHHTEKQTDEYDFLADGHWKPEIGPIHAWPENPDALLERQQFREVLAGCLERLPPKTAQVFTLREMDELETAEICRLVGVTPTNMSVILYRARKQLRNCLSHRYFGLHQEHEA
ncbi:sigma-70 family RNA polymerase sigma factor [Petrachloros mirabilis]